MVIEKMYSKISSQQADSDRIFAELEKKRMKLEHELLKMQQDRQREESERAERQRRKDREFQLKMVSMMYGQQHHLNPAIFSGMCQVAIVVVVSTSTIVMVKTALMVNVLSHCKTSKDLCCYTQYT